MYSKELTLNKSNISNDRTPFCDLDLKIGQGCLYIKIYDKRDDFSSLKLILRFMMGMYL